LITSHQASTLTGECRRLVCTQCCTCHRKSRNRTTAQQNISPWKSTTWWNFLCKSSIV